MKDFHFAVALSCLALIAVAPATAKEKKPVNGSWQIAPIAIKTPTTIMVSSEESILLRQPVIPEAIRIATAPLMVGKLSIAEGDVLFRATTKQGTAWCALEPLRVLPKEKKVTGLAKAFLGGPLNGPGPDTLCLGDADGDGTMESAMTGSSKGYVLPIITKLSKPIPVTPFATITGDPQSIKDWHVQLMAAAAARKDGTDIIYSVILTSPSGMMSIDGFRLLAGEGLSFAIYGNLATIESKFDSVTPARVTQGATGTDGRVEMRVESTMEARSMTLGNPQPY